MLLHGWRATADLNWSLHYLPIAEHYRVVAMDLRGHGRGVDSLERFTLDRCSDDLAAMLGVLGLDTAIIAGYSMGGAVAQVFARDHPELVSGLVLAATAARFFTKSAWVEAQRVAMLALAPLLDLPPRAWVRAPLEPAVRAATASLGDWAADEILNSRPAALVQAAAALRSFDSTPWLHTLTTPASVVITDLDTTVPPGGQVALAHALGAVSTHHIPAAHDAWLAHPRRFSSAIIAACADTQRR